MEILSAVAFYAKMARFPTNKNATIIINKRTLERSVKIFLLEGLNLSHGNNLTLSSDVDQDTFYQ